MPFKNEHRRSSFVISRTKATNSPDRLRRSLFEENDPEGVASNMRFWSEPHRPIVRAEPAA